MQPTSYQSIQPPTISEPSSALVPNVSYATNPMFNPNVFPLNYPDGQPLVNYNPNLSTNTNSFQPQQHQYQPQPTPPLSQQQQQQQQQLYPPTENDIPLNNHVQHQQTETKYQPEGEF